MCALMVVNEGEIEALKRIVNYSATGDLKLKLYSNNATLADTTVVGDLTEVTGSNYASKTLTGASWVVSANPITYPEQTFTFTSDATAYGYYVTNSGGTVLMWAEAFGSAYTIPADGGQIKITPKLGAD